MDPPAVNALSPPPTPPALNTNTSVPVSPKTNALPRHARSGAQNHDSKNEEGAYGRPPEGINALSFKLLVKVQEVFGPQSKEWVELNRALISFKHGDMSKRDAFRIMKQVIGDKKELDHGLSEILGHSDADWIPEDWSRSIDASVFPQTVNPTSPNFLQPAHEPQPVRLPSLFQTLGGDQPASRPLSSINPAVLQSSTLGMDYAALKRAASNEYNDGLGMHAAAGFDGYSGYGSQQHQLSQQYQGTHLNWSSNPLAVSNMSSPATFMPNAVAHSQYYTPSSWHQDPTLTPSRTMSQDLDQESALSLLNGFGHSGEPTASAMSPPSQIYQQYSHEPHWQGNNLMNGSVGDRNWQYAQDRVIAPHLPSQFDASIQQERTPQLVPGQLSSNASPSMIQTPPTSGVVNVPVLIQDTPDNGWQAEGTMTPDNSFEDAEPYGVRPHTAKLPVHSDVKPRKVSSSGSGKFIHAICGRGFSTRSAVKKHHWGPKSGDLETIRGCWAKNKKPDIAWDAHPSCKEVPGRPNTNAPKRAAIEDDDDYVPTRPSSEAPPAPSMVSRPPKSQQFGNPQTHGLDTLLSAASYQETLSAPQPQDGRNDSVVAHLDAQVAAAERNKRILPPWATSFSPELTPGIGLGITHSAPGLAFPNLTFVPQGQETPGTVAFTSPEGRSSYTQAPQNGETIDLTKTDGNVGKKRQRAPGKRATASKRESKQPDASSSSPGLKKAKIQY